MISLYSFHHRHLHCVILWFILAQVAYKAIRFLFISMWPQFLQLYSATYSSLIIKCYYINKINEKSLKGLHLKRGFVTLEKRDNIIKYNDDNRPRFICSVIMT